jgi:hypothetical protein
LFPEANRKYRVTDLRRTLLTEVRTNRHGTTVANDERRIS